MKTGEAATSLLRLLPPEAAHTATITALKSGRAQPPGLDPRRWGTQVKLPQSGLVLANPVGLAAGFDKNAEVYAAMAGYGFGLIECGTVTPLPQSGNPKPRVFRLPGDGAVINRLGFNNRGLTAFVSNLRCAIDVAVPVGANVGANKDSADRIGDYAQGIAAVYAHADYLTINISSPNTPGLRGLQDKGALEELLARCGQAQEASQRAFAAELRRDGRFEDEDDWKPVFLKVAPDLDEKAVEDVVEAVRGPGRWLSGLIVSNTTLSRPETLSGRHREEAGGLSGAPLMDLSTRVLRQFATHLFGEFDLIGAGGIASGADAYAKIRAGAHAVQLYTALIYHGPDLVAEINRELAASLKADGFASLSEAVGADLA